MVASASMKIKVKMGRKKMKWIKSSMGQNFGSLLLVAMTKLDDKGVNNFFHVPMAHTALLSRCI